MAPPKKVLTPAERKSLLEQAKGALANRTDPGHLAVAQETPREGSPAEGAQVAPATPDAGEPDVSPAGAQAVEHEVFRQSRLPEPALNRLARAWVDSDAADEAFRRAVVDLFQEWEQSATGEAAKREDLYFEAKALRRWRDRLVQMAKAGEKQELRELRMRAMR